MGRKQLVLDALNNRQTERIPVSFWFHFVADKDKAKGMGDRSFVDRNIEGHRRYFNAVQPDFVKIMSDGYFGYPSGGEQEPKIGTIQDLEKLQPLTADHPWIRGQIDLIKQVVSLQADTMYFYNVFGPATVLKRLAGPEKVLEFLKTEPAKTAAALQRLARGIAAQAEAAIKSGGADGVYLSVQNPDINRLSDDDYHKYVTPADTIVLDAANAAGGNNILHICGYQGCKNHLEAWKGYHAKAYSWAVNVENVSLSEGKRIFGGAAVIGGFANTPGSPIHRGTREEIERITETLIAGAGKTGVLLGADCTVPDDFEFERLDWVRQKAASL
ncbi:MAG: uroporphyrinogen decarboxylase family protein [Treponemataceae bacterium]|nr:MAG: uroporphyrinogen decarboxylase family protein [Treponemataceae bacterium]